MILAPFEAASLMMEIVFWTLPSRSSHTLTKYELIAASIHAGNNVRFSLDSATLNTVVSALEGVRVIGILVFSGLCG